MAGESKKHHFVPKSILKNFYSSDGRLFVYDKKNGKSFPSTVENAGHENNFNSVTIEDQTINFETFYDKIDSEQAQLLQKIIGFTDFWGLGELDIYKLAYFTLIQMNRTKISRTSIVEFTRDLQQKMDDMVKNTPYTSTNVKIDDDGSRVAALMSTISSFNKIDHLLQRRLSIVRAPENKPFICSDNPVVMYNPYAYLQTALGGVGTEICFPISKTLLLNFSCESTCRKLYLTYHALKEKGGFIPASISSLYDQLFSQKITTIEPEYVNFYNSLQVSCSSRFLYSSNEDFDVARQVIDQDPTLKEVTKTVGLENRSFPRMPKGNQIAVVLKNKDHYLISVEILNDDITIEFRVNEDEKHKIDLLLSLSSNPGIDYIQVFKEGNETRFMRDIEIAEYNRESRIGFIRHSKASGIEDMLRQIRKITKPKTD